MYLQYVFCRKRKTFLLFCFVSSYCKSNRRRLWGEILEQPAAVEGDLKSFSNSGSFHTNDTRQRRNNCKRISMSAGS